MPDNIHENIIKLDVDKVQNLAISNNEGIDHRLLSTIEQLAQSKQELRKENQQLKDEKIA